MQADHGGGYSSNYMSTDNFGFGGSGDKKGKKGKKEFIVANDEYEGQWEVVNGEIVHWFNNYLNDVDSDDHILMGYCGSTLCDTADVKALVSGESRKDGDMLVIDMSWNAYTEFEITCPEVFHDPQVELLACQRFGGGSCTNTTCGGTQPSPNACFAEFETRLSEHFDNTIYVEGLDPARIRLKVLCVDFLSW